MFNNVSPRLKNAQPIKEQNLNIARDVKILFRNDQWRILFRL